MKKIIGGNMKEKIGETAGSIWKTLREKDRVALTQLPKMVKEKDTIVYQALGWLAREDKIIYDKTGNIIFVSLTQSERES